jgi:hypothetical protein
MAGDRERASIREQGLGFEPAAVGPIASWFGDSSATEGYRQKPEHDEHDQRRDIDHAGTRNDLAEWRDDWFGDLVQHHDNRVIGANVGYPRDNGSPNDRPTKDLQQNADKSQDKSHRLGSSLGQSDSESRSFDRVTP